MASDFGSVALKASGSLFLIVGLIICLFFLVKRFRLGALSPMGYPQMRLIGKLHVAPKRAIALVEVQDQWLLLGVGTESINLISKLERPPETNSPEYKASGNDRKGLWESALNLARKGRDGKS